MEEMPTHTHIAGVKTYVGEGGQFFLRGPDQTLWLWGEEEMACPADDCDWKYPVTDDTTVGELHREAHKHWHECRELEGQAT